MVDVKEVSDFDETDETKYEGDSHWEFTITAEHLLTTYFPIFIIFGIVIVVRSTITTVIKCLKNLLY